jgi:hypothetical protein
LPELVFEGVELSLDLRPAFHAENAVGVPHNHGDAAVTDK